MDIITAAGGGLAGSALGAAFGALGSIVNRGIGIFETREKRKDRQLEMAHEVERWQIDITLAADARAGEIRKLQLKRWRALVYTRKGWPQATIGSLAANTPSQANRCSPTTLTFRHQRLQSGT